MKKEGHPKYQDVLFVDSSTGHKFVIGSTLQPKETEKHQGKEYPVCRVPVSSSSHPFFTGSKQLVDAEGRVDKFRKRYQSGGLKNAGGQGQNNAGQEQKKEEDKTAAAKKPKAKTKK